jgi:hypothetical protein
LDVVEQFGGTSFIHGTLNSGEELSNIVNCKTIATQGQSLRISKPKHGTVHLFLTTEG